MFLIFEMNLVPEIMDAIQIVGLFAAALTTAANLPQAYIIIREKSTQHVSSVTYGLLFLGTGGWVVYGVMKSDWPILIANAISLLACAVILLLKFTSQKVMDKVHQSVLPEELKKKSGPKTNSRTNPGAHKK